MFTELEEPARVTSLAIKTGKPDLRKVSSVMLQGCAPGPRACPSAEWSIRRRRAGVERCANRSRLHEHLGVSRVRVVLLLRNGEG